jgi:hypothetical protein
MMQIVMRDVPVEVDKVNAFAFVSAEDSGSILQCRQGVKDGANGIMVQIFTRDVPVEVDKVDAAFISS